MFLTVTVIFFKKRSYFLEGKCRRKKGRETNGCVAAPHRPPLGTWPAALACA